MDGFPDIRESGFRQTTSSRKGSWIKWAWACLGLFLTYAVIYHWPTEYFVGFLSLFFQGIKLHTASHVGDIMVLVVLALSVSGVYYIVKEHGFIAFWATAFIIMAYLVDPDNANTKEKYSNKIQQFAGLK